jgi:hypothetical protein
MARDTKHPWRVMQKAILIVPGKLPRSLKDTLWSLEQHIDPNSGLVCGCWNTKQIQLK